MVDTKLVEMSDVLENAAYVLREDIELYAGNSSCGPCGGKCYGPNPPPCAPPCSPPCGSPCRPHNEGGLAQKVLGMLE